MTITVRPATVFVCVSYRIGSKENRMLRGPARAERVRALCAQDPPPGVLAYEGDVPVDTASVLDGFPRVLMRYDLR